MTTNSKKPCKFAINPSGNCWECAVYRSTYCADQKFDRNPDGSVNIVICCYAKRMLKSEKGGKAHG